MNKKIKLAKLLTLLMVFCVGVMKVDALSVDSLKYRINSSNKSFDIYGTIDTNQEFGSTYANEGYFTFLKVGDNSYSYIDTFNADKVVDGVKVNISLSEASDNNSVVVKYSFTNVSDETLTFKLGTYGDNLLAFNDKAAIYKDGHSKIIVTQDNLTNFSETYGTQFSISFFPEVNTIWLGEYDYNVAVTEHMFEDGDILSYTYFDNVDTVITYSWSDTLLVNETKTYTATFNARITDSSTVKFYKYGESSPIVKDVLVGGAVKTETVHNDENFIYEWNTKKDGTGKYYPADKSIIVSEKDMILYEVKFDKNHNVVIDANENVIITTESGSSVEHHGTLKYNLTPKQGYKIISVKVNDVEKLSEVKDNVLTISDVMGNVNISVKAVLDYKLTEGLNQKYVVNKDSYLKFKVNASYDAFNNGGKIYINNVLVDKQNYSFENSDGNTLFTLNKKYLDSLSNGKYEIKFVFNDEGEADASFNVVNDSTSIDNPQTGDNIIIYIVIGTLSMICFIGSGIHICKRNQEN